MKPIHDSHLSQRTDTTPPYGQSFKGRYVGVLRSSKGKIKGLHLQIGQRVEQIKLPKYLRPLLLRGLEPGAFIQVWAYPHKDAWRAVNFAELEPSEVATLAQEIDSTEPETLPVAKSPCMSIQVCRKGTCHKRGSDRIWRELEAEIATNPQLQGVTLERTGCLKACKQGPNVRLLPSGKVLKGVTPETIQADVCSRIGR